MVRIACPLQTTQENHMPTYQIHTIASAPEKSKPAREQLQQAFGTMKETRTSTCTRIIVVENGFDRITFKVNEHLTYWAKSFPNTSQKVSSRSRNSLSCRRIIEANKAR
jgi:hypothetical protein